MLSIRSEIATDIQEADLPGMATQINTLTENATEGVSTTMNKIDSINIEELNDSISRLDAATAAFQGTVEALNAIFGR